MGSGSPGQDEPGDASPAGPGLRLQPRFPHGGRAAPLSLRIPGCGSEHEARRGKAQGHGKQEEEEEGKAPEGREMRSGRARSVRGRGTRTQAGRDVAAAGAGSGRQPWLGTAPSPAHLAGVTPVPSPAVSARSWQHEEGRTDRHKEPRASPWEKEQKAKGDTEK
ncbi:translation initiation factor IF-2-like [Oenanthe melanoleuca]|uniref:translation initiation factor IF-2-like n=1 Tax=Oenanthe melanoleuca TaxID=2939378 RepID=UPI0024C1BC02|nr:translation initiation factor IF-2-like [Oenanthe melanoleuca]